MKKLVHRYLSETFFVKKDGFRYFSKPWYISSDDLIEDLNKIFDLNKKELKWLVKSWVRKQNVEFNFNNWWTPKINSLPQMFLPMVRRTVSSTLVENLISVQPMDAPTGDGQLFYFDFQYTDTFTPRLGITERYGKTAII